MTPSQSSRTSSAAKPLVLALLLVALVWAVNAGCAATPPAAATEKKVEPKPPLTSEELVRHVQSVADRFMSREAQVFAELEEGSANPKVRAWARFNKFGQTLAALSIATGPNPYENAVDLVVMISLKKASIEVNEAKTLLTPKEVAPLLEAYTRAEASAWELVERTLKPENVQEIKDKIRQFSAENPNLRYVGFVRFADLSRNNPDAGKRSPTASSLLSLFYLDPLAQLDPATRELHETRMLAERAAYLIQRMPIILQWSIRQGAADIFELPESQQIITATTQFAAASNRFADATAAYPQALNAEREAAVGQLIQGVDAQRRAATADIESQQTHLHQLIGEVTGSIDHAAQAALQVNNATAQTIDGVEAGVRRTLTLAFWLGLALLACLLVGIPLSAMVYRRMTRTERDRALRRVLANGPPAADGGAADYARATRR